MSDLLAARSQMAISLAFHILFAVAGIGLPALMVIAEWRWLRTGDAVYHELARRWAKGAAILFAVGAVSGTVLSFELGLLWPSFMRFAGPVIGMPFSLEGFAFFTEAIFLGVYLYGWKRVPPRTHLVAGMLVAASGMLSGIFVVIANAWMNAPAGFQLVGGQMTDIDPIAGMFNPAWFQQTLHMTLAAYAATGLGAAGIHAFMLRRRPGSRFHRCGLVVALLVGGPAAVLQPLSGDLSGRHVAREQPAKLAAMEAHFTTEAPAPLIIGGWPDMGARTTRWAIHVPAGLSFLVHHDLHSEVPGLDRIPRNEWPPVPIVHLAFDLMVALGLYMAAVSLAAAWQLVRRRDPAAQRWLLTALAAAAPMGFLAVEAGWVVTEVGRQPWVIQGILRTADAVTPMPGLIVPFTTFTLLYCFLGAIVAWLLSLQIRESPGGKEAAHA